MIMYLVKGFMFWGVNERYLFIIFFYYVSVNVLSDFFSFCVSDFFIMDFI